MYLTKRTGSKDLGILRQHSSSEGEKQATQMSINEWKNKTYYTAAKWTLLSLKKERNHDKCQNIEQSNGHYAESSKPDTMW